MTKVVYFTNAQWMYAKTALKACRETDKEKRELYFGTIQEIFNGMDAK